MIILLQPTMHAKNNEQLLLSVHPALSKGWWQNLNSAVDRALQGTEAVRLERLSFNCFCIAKACLPRSFQNCAGNVCADASYLSTLELRWCSSRARNSSQKRMRMRIHGLHGLGTHFCPDGKVQLGFWGTHHLLAISFMVGFCGWYIHGLRSGCSWAFYDSAQNEHFWKNKNVFGQILPAVYIL